MMHSWGSEHFTQCTVFTPQLILSLTPYRGGFIIPYRNPGAMAAGIVSRYKTGLRLDTYR